MLLAHCFCWGMAIVALFIFLKFYFLPYIKNKWMFYIMSRQIKIIAKKYDGETEEQLKKIAKGLMDLSKSEKLIDNEHEEV